MIDLKALKESYEIYGQKKDEMFIGGYKTTECGMIEHALIILTTEYYRKGSKRINTTYEINPQGYVKKTINESGTYSGMGMTTRYWKDYTVPEKTTKFRLQSVTAKDQVKELKNSL